MTALLQKIENQKYRILKKIGEGGTGEVFFAINVKTNEQVAIKTVYFGESKSARKVYSREVKIATQLRHHPNIVRIIEHYIIESERVGVIVMERMDVDLLDYCLAAPCLSLNDQIEIFRAICNAVAHMHSHKIAHCDIKPENVLLRLTEGKVSEVKLCDFGYAHEIRRAVSGKFGTNEYLAPEALNYFHYVDQFPTMSKLISSKLRLDKVDMWSVGSLMFVMFCGRFPRVQIDRMLFKFVNFEASSKLIAQYKFVGEVGEAAVDFQPRLEQASVEVCRLMQLLVHDDPLMRPSIGCLINSPLFRMRYSAAASAPEIDLLNDSNHCAINHFESESNLSFSERVIKCLSHSLKFASS